MSTYAAVGKSSHRRARAAGLEAAQAALRGIAPAKPNLVLVFATTGYPQAELIEAVAEVTDAPISGCSGEGIITQSGSDEGAHVVAVMAIASDRMTFDALTVEGLSKDSAACGKALAEQVRALGPRDGRALLLFPDGLQGNLSAMLAALHEALPFPVALAGGGASEIAEHEPERMAGATNYQYHRTGVRSDSVSAVLVSGDVRVHTAVSHGCVPIGRVRTITDSDGRTVRQIDGRPAWSVFQEYIDGDSTDLDYALAAHLSLAQQVGAKREAGVTAIRTPLGLDKPSGAVLFPAGLPQGSRVQVVRADAERTKENAATCAKGFPPRPDLVLQFDCIGRGRFLFGEATDEHAVLPLQEAIGRDVPWAGFHSHSEIAQIDGKPYCHNFTVVLCALYEGAREEAA